MIRTIAILAAIVVGFAGTAASAAVINLSAVIDGTQANAGAGSGSLGTGSGTMTLDTATNLLTWNITWAGLSGPATVAHFHGAANPNQNAGVQIAIGTVSPEINNAVLTDQQESDILAGLWYINIHTAQFAGGEIRGQVLVGSRGQSVETPTSLSILLFGLLGLPLAMRRRPPKD